MIGLFSDSHGDLDAFEAAYELLRARGARRYLFAGGRYTDLDEWILRRRERARGGRSYGDLDFLTDISNFLAAEAPVARPPAFGESPAAAAEAGAPGDEHGELERLKERFVRTPEKDSLAYRDPAVARKAVDMLGDTLCCMVHDKNELDREDLLNASVFIHGKTSEPKVVQIGPRYFLTPGSLTGAAEQTCALLEKDERNLRFSAFTLDGRLLIDRQVLALDRRTKLQVK